MEKESGIDKDKSFVGIDLAKRTMQVVRINSAGKKGHEWKKLKTNDTGIRTLINWLKKEDVVVLEAGSQCFRIAKRIIKDVSCEVIVLNPGDVATIYKSLKKTDKEDALNLARLAQRNPKQELPEVPIPTDSEEHIRALSTEQAHWSKLSTLNKNRLHSLFTQAGLTEISKKELKTHEWRIKTISLLPAKYQVSAKRLVSHLELIDNTIEDTNKQIKDVLKENVAYSSLVMSMPGIGPIITLALLGFVGKCNRFSKPGQLSYYVGLVPKVDISGNVVHYGRILKTGCRPIRRAIIQGAWSLVRSRHGGELKLFFERLKAKKGSRKAIVAVARKMLEVIYRMLKTGEFYRYMPELALEAKLKGYGIV